MSDASSGGGYNLGPAKKRVNKGKSRKVTTVPTRYVAAPVRPPASWTNPVRPVSVQPPKPKRVTPKPVRINGRLPTYAQSPKTVVRQDRHRAMHQRAQQVHAAARRDVLASLGLGPRRTLTSVGFAPSPHLYVGPHLPNARDSGVANNVVPRYGGVVLSPQQIQHDIAAVIAPGHSQRKQAAIGRLHAAGIVDPFGTTTHPERVAADRRTLRAAQGAFLRRYRELSKLDYGVGHKTLTDAQVLERIRGRSADELIRAVRDYQPTGLQMQAARVQTEGLSGNPLALLKSIPDTLMTGLAAAGEGVRSIGGDNLASNAISDALFFPIGAVGAAASAAAHPKEALDAISSGVIGHLLRGDVQGAKDFASQHPLFAGLEVAGGVTAAGRTAGAIGRTATGGRVFSTVRAPIAHVNVPNTGLIDRRSYSKDVTRRAAQQAFDKYVLRDGPMVNGVRTRMSPSRAHADWRSRKFADYIASRANSRERANREEVAREVMGAAPVRQHRGGKAGNAVGHVVDRVLPAGPRYGEGRFHLISRMVPKRLFRAERDVVTMVLEGVVRSRKTFVTDLKKERTRLEDVYRKERDTLDKADVVANRQRAAAIDRVLNDPKALKNADGVFKSAERLAPLFHELEREAVERGALNPERAARRTLFPTAQAHQGAVYRDDALRKPEGDLPNEDIIRAFKEQGGNPDLLTYLPHSMRLRGPAAFHQRFGQQRPNYEGAHTSQGEMFRRGSSPFDFQHLAETAIGKSNRVGNIREYDDLLRTTGIRHTDGQYLTADEARRWLKNGYDDEGNPLPKNLVMKRAFNSKVSDEQLTRIEEQQAVNPGGARSFIDQHYEARTVPKTGPTSQARNVVMIPATIDRRVQEHIGIAGRATKDLQMVQGLFRRAVLPLSLKWMFGNVAEATLRSITEGVVPGVDNRLGRKVIKRLTEMDQRAGKAFDAEVAGGLFIGTRSLSNRRGPSVKNIPVVNELVTTIRAATDAGFAFNRMLEREFQFAALGKHTRKQMQEMTGSWMKAMRAQDKAIEDVAKGLKDTPNQIQAARYLDQVLGQYSRFSPAMRGIVQTYTPFLPWYVNSVRFVAWTLPVHHTLKTSLLGLVEAEFQKDYEQQHDDKLTRHGDLATAIKTKDGGWLTAARYTPFGFLGPVAAGGKESASPVASLFMPQIMGAILAGYGVDPFGQEIQIPKKYGGTGEVSGGDIWKIIANTAAEGFIPGLSIARRVREHGETALPGSTVFDPRTKGPDSSHGQSALERIFNPLRPIYLRAPDGKSVLHPEVQKAIDKAVDGGGAVLPKKVQDALDRALDG